MSQKLDGILQQNTHGIWRVSGTKVSLDSLIYSFLDGCSPEAIAQDFPIVPLADVYLVIGYYMKNSAEVDAYLQEQRRLDDESREYWEQKFPPQLTRAQLLARQAASA